jgi:hypothetical protein
MKKIKKGCLLLLNGRDGDLIMKFSNSKMKNQPKNPKKSAFSRLINKKGI